MTSTEVVGLPSPLTRMLGREDELDAVTRMLIDEQHRLVTITGPGGIGKSRLAVAAARAVEAAFPDGIAFVDLAPVEDPDQVIPAIAHALGIRDTGEPPLDGEARDRTGRPSHAAGPRQRRAGRRRRPGAQCAARGHLGLGARHEPDPAADRRRAEHRPRPASRGGGGRPVRGAGSGGEARLRGDRRECGIRRRDLRCARWRAPRSSSSRQPVRGS